jgi:hypothetical protein
MPIFRLPFGTSCSTTIKGREGWKLGAAMSPNTIDEARRQSRRENVGKRGYRCYKCGEREARHKVNGVPLCCECYVAAGHEPADWHPNCMAAYALRKTWR